MSCSNQIICYTSPHLSLHVPFFFLLIILTHCYVIVYSFYYPPLQAYLQYKKSLSNIIHLSHRKIQVCLSLGIHYNISAVKEKEQLFFTTAQNKFHYAVLLSIIKWSSSSILSLKFSDRLSKTIPII